jgi:hypothetical protein
LWLKNSKHKQDFGVFYFRCAYHHGLAVYLLLLLLLFGLCGYWHCGHYWPIVPASGDSEDDCGEADGM